MEYRASVNNATKTMSSKAAAFACAAMAASTILIIRTLSLSLSVLLVAVLCGLLISLVLRHAGRFRSTTVKS